MSKEIHNEAGTIQLLTERLSEMGYEFISFDKASNKATYKCTRCGTVSTAHKVTINKEYTDKRWKLCPVCQYSNIHIADLHKKYKQDGNSRAFISSVKKCKQYIDELTELTSFLDADATIEERIYCIINDIQSLDDIMCPYCKTHKLKWSNSFGKSYNQTCGNKSCDSTFMSKLMSNVDSNGIYAEKFKKWQSELTVVNDDVVKSIRYGEYAKYIDNPLLVDYLNNRFKDIESLKESIERIKYGVEEKPTCACPGCNNHVKWQGKPTNYHQYCSVECSNKAKQMNVSSFNNGVLDNIGNVPVITTSNNKSSIKQWLTQWFEVQDAPGFDFYVPKYNLYIDCNNFSTTKRETAAHSDYNYLEIHSCNDENDLRNQLSLYLNCLLDNNPLSYSKITINKEFEYYKTLKCDTDEALSSYPSQKNSIVKDYQFCEFYKKEMDIYAHNPVLRRKLIENRIQYLNKPEHEISASELFNGFKISGIYYGYSHFNPVWTNWFINKYNVHSVYDPCSGWGHHMLGMLSCDKIIYNDFNTAVCNNIQKMKDDLSITNLEIHNDNAMTYIPDTNVDAWFMCPPYFNVEKYNGKEFKDISDYKEFLNKIFDNWNNSASNIFGLIIREDFIDLIDYNYAEVFELNTNPSHFQNVNGKKNKEKFYIFDKTKTLMIKKEHPTTIVEEVQQEVQQEPNVNTVASETQVQPVEKKTPIVGCAEFKKNKKKSSVKSATTHKPCPYKDFNELYEKVEKNAKKVLLYLRNADNLQLLINATPTLPADIDKSTRFYCWREGLTEIPKCLHCGKPRRFEGVFEGFFATCGDPACKSAAKSDANRNRAVDWKEVQRKKEETYAAKHNGIRHNMQDPEACKKFFDDYKAKHNGESCGVQSKKAIENRQKTIDEKYGGNIRNAFEQGLIKKYGSVAEAGRITGQAGLKKMNENKEQFFLDRLDEMGYDFIESIDDDKVKLRCRNCGNEFEISRQNINVLYRSGTFYLCDKCTFENFLEDYLAGDYTTRQFITIVKLWSGYTEAVIRRTSFLDEYNPTITERLYYIVNDLDKIVKCKYCGKKASWNSKDQLDLGYYITCASKECLSKHFTEYRTGKTVISENRVNNFQEWQETVTEVNDDIIKENIKYDTLVPYITNPVILDYLEHRFPDSDSIEETLARIELGVEEKPECANSECHNHVVWIGRKRALYTTYCCDSCSARSEETQRKKDETNIKNWGTRGIWDSSVYQQHYYEKTGYKSWVDNPEIKYKIYLGQKRSAMGGTSKMEQRFYKALEDLGYKFEQQYMSEEYPFKCDAYIPDLDLYIEYQGWQGHGDHPFDPNNPEDIEQLEAWKRGEERCLEVNRNTRYTGMIDTWTVRDPHKRSFVDKNHLKMLEVFDYKDSHDLQRQIDEYMKKFKPAALF